MNIIETLNPPAFTEYLKRFNNTICGRHPIGVLLQVMMVFGNFYSSFFYAMIFLFHCVKHI